MIREATIKDAQKIAEIIVTTWQTAYNGIIDPKHPANMKPEKLVNHLVKNISRKKEKVLVYEDNSIICGFISGTLNNDNYDCEVVGFYILPDRQGQGIGKQLLDEMIKIFKNKDCSSMIIWTLLNAKNNAFYINQGGHPLEKKEIQIGDDNYPGIGFVYKL